MALNFLKFARWLRTTPYRPSERLLLLAVALRCDDLGETFAGYDTLHEDTGLCCKQIGRLVRRLQSKGGLIVTPRPGTTAILCCVTPDNMSEVTGDMKSPQSGHHVRSDTMSDQTPCPGGQDTMSGGARTPCPGGQDMVSHDLRTDLPSDLPSDVRRVAPARDDHPPLQGPDQTDDERTTSEQTAGYLADIRQQGEDRRAGSQTRERRPRRQHPREQTYCGNLLSPEAGQIHELLIKHKLPLLSSVGTANHIAGRLGLGGNNKLTVARVKLAVETVADKCAFAAAAGAPRTTEEVWDHLQRFLRYSDGRWKRLEQKLREDAEEDEGYKPPPDLFRPEPEPTPEERERRREAQRAGCAAILEAVKNAKRRPGPLGPPKPNSPGSDVES